MAMKLIGITGTKGKTTTAFMISEIMIASGYKTAVVGTMGAYINDNHYDLKNTTPDLRTLLPLIQMAYECDTDYFILEVSSQGLKQGRVSGIIFDYAIFTNLSKDHISIYEHASMDEYIYYKSILFKSCDVAIMNMDDECVGDMLKYLSGPAYFYGTSNFDNSEEFENDNNDKNGKYDKNHVPYIVANKVKCSTGSENIGVKFNVKGAYEGEIFLDRLGCFNVYNALAAMCLAHLEGIKMEKIKEVFARFKTEGRTEGYRIKNGVYVMIDYAHNCASMESILKAVRKYDFNRIICVFGCGGNRAIDRRFDMGYVSGIYSDLTVITSDNSRFEDIDKIIEDIEKGMLKTDGKYAIIKDRRKAIEYAIGEAKENDIVLLLGKGHEKYQEINGIKYPFDERDIIHNIK